MLAAQERRAPRAPDRIAYVDGVRGLAIALVLVYHSWGNLHVSASGNAFNFVASQGFEGVSLFFVISGFCLSFPLWKRRYAGIERWFVPSEFFVRRCLRILPPYYVALVLFAAVKVAASHHHSQALATREAPLTLPDLIAHVFLIHNLTPYINSINGMFWSLGLEWQWYWVFPILLVLCIRSPGLALAGCLVLTVFWHLGMHDLWGMGALPPRLFEFCCGIIAASLVAGQKRISPALLLSGLVIPLSVLEIAHTTDIPALTRFVSFTSLGQPLFGIVFASLILLGYQSRFANGVLSWKPLVLLGIASYSVYLVHGPVLTRLYLLAPGSLRQPLIIVPLAWILGILSGVAFHLVIERPCMRKSTWTRVIPVLSRALAWTDLLWGSFSNLRLGSRSAAGGLRPVPLAPIAQDAAEPAQGQAS